MKKSLLLLLCFTSLAYATTAQISFTSANVPQGKQQRTIDVSNMPNGVYVLYLGGEKDKRLGMRKIVVQH